MHFFTKFFLNVRGISAQKIYNMHIDFLTLQIGDNPNNQAFSVSWLPVNINALELLFLEKNIHFTTNISISTGYRHFEVICIHKTLLTLGNEKERQEVKFYEKSLGEFILSWVTKNVKMFHFTRLRG